MFLDVNDYASTFTQGSGHSQEGYLIDDRTPPHRAIMCQSGPLPNNAVHPGFLHHTANTRITQRICKADGKYSNSDLKSWQPSDVLCLSDITPDPKIWLNLGVCLDSPATQAFDSLLFFRKFGLVVLCDFKRLECDVGVIFFHPDHDCWIPHMGDVHVDSSNHNYAGRGAGCAGQACNSLRPLCCEKISKKSWE